MFFRAGRDETMSCDTYRRDARYRLGSTRTVSVLCVGATEESTQSGTEWSPNVASGASTRSVRRSTSNLRWRKICDGEARDGQSGTVRLLKNEKRVPSDDASVRRAAARRRRAGPSGRRKRAESRRNARKTIDDEFFVASREEKADKKRDSLRKVREESSPRRRIGR